MIRIDRFSDGTDADARHWDARWQAWDANRVMAAVVWEGMVPVMRGWFPPGARLLEAGCGTGKYCVALRQHGYRMTGIDYSPTGIDLLSRIAPSIPAVVGSVLEMPFADGEFDGAVSLGVVEHFEEGPGAALAELARVIRPGGRLFLTVPLENWLWDLWLRQSAAAPLPLRRSDEVAPAMDAVKAAQGGAARTRVFHQYLHRKDEIGGALARAGFQQRGVRYLGKRLGLTEYLSGLSTILDTSRCDPPEEPRGGKTRRRLKHYLPKLARAARTAQQALVERALPGRVCAHTIGFLAIRR